MNILEKIAERTRERVAEAKKSDFPFERAIRQFSDIAMICEVKKASPSKGIIAEYFPYMDIAKDYIDAGAAAISVLTEPFYFKGADQYLQEISELNTPTLRKDFIIDPYMIYQAKFLGASAVLFICAMLDKATLTEYIKLAHEIGLSALVEAHDEAEVEMALDSGARVIGVNNRNLKTFEVNISISIRLRELVPKDVLFVAESGISTAEDIAALRAAKVDAVLIGEHIMKAADKKAAMAKLWSR